ncbi:MAG: hypothetical protein J6I49_08000 [Bacteroidales bacterium]|nr:hypothetical protein [Bacteroidales bacterium]
MTFKRNTNTMTFKYALLLVGLSLLSGCSSFHKAPAWTRKVPLPENDTYLYVCESATAGLERDARNQAISRVFQTTAMRLGVPLDSQKVFEAVQNGDDLSVISREYNIPVNKICEYTEKVGFYYKAYVLCQVASKGNNPPRFDSSFRKCQ